MPNRFATVRRTILILLLVLLPMVTSCRMWVEGRLEEYLLAQVQNQIKDELGFSIHLLVDPLPAGTLIQPDVPGGTSDPADSIECEGECLLAMIDLMPGAHFGHPVVFAVYDFGAWELKGPVAADWWPWVPATGKRFFHTVKERRKTVIRCDPDCTTVYPEPEPEVRVALSPMGLPDYSPMHCPVWAVIVNGYDDTDDSFDEDTDGMYRVLRGMGVDDLCICYLTDDENATEKDAPARPDNFAKALNYIADRTSEGEDLAARASAIADGKRYCGSGLGGRVPDQHSPTDDLLVFISSHGTNNANSPRPPEVLCNHFKEGGGYITSPDLTRRLNDINTNRTTVVIEACYSGSFHNDLDQLQNASFFYSAGASQKSFGDRDPPDYPDTNPGDTGSEAIWGFVEAFGTSSADVPSGAAAADGKISFAEAVNYAQANDATPRVGGQLRSIVQSTFVDPNPVPYLDDTSPPPAGLSLQLTPVNATTVTAKRCQSNRFDFELTVTAPPTGLGVGTLRFHVEEPSDVDVNDWDHADTIIVSGLEAGPTRAVGFNWAVPSRFATGSTFELIAHVDSPHAPVGGAPSQNVAVPGVIESPNNTFLPCGCRACRENE